MQIIYDCRKQGREPGSKQFPCSVRIVDPVDGQRIPFVFFVSTDPLAQVGRFTCDSAGNPLAGKRNKRMVPNGRGGKKVEYYWDRLEIWEYRPWIALSLKTGEMIAKSSEDS